MAEMNETWFWKMIETSKTNDMVFENQINCLVDKLSLLPEDSLLGFEKILRQLIHQSGDYGVLAALFIVDKTVSDDSFLYFRCWLIAQGKIVFESALKNPDTLASLKTIDFDIGEKLLYVSDNAFFKKFGKDTDKEQPRDFFSSTLDYNFESDFHGMDWQEKDLPERYPELVSRYGI